MNERNSSEITISWLTLWRVFWMLVLAILLFAIKDIILILFLALVISSAFDSPVNYFEKKGIPRVFGTLFIFLALFSVLALILYTIIPITIIEFNDFLGGISERSLPILGSLDVSSWVLKITDNLGGLADSLFSGGLSFFNLIAQVFGNIVLIVTTVIISFYLTVRRGGVEDFLKAILPLSYEDYVVDLYLRVRKKLGAWLQGQALLMLAVGLLMYAGLWIIGVKYSLLLGIISGLLEIVPVAGPIFSAILVFFAAVSDSWAIGFYALGLSFLIQQLENNLLVPVIMRKTVGISPVLVIISIIAGEQIAGVVGMIIAVPVAVVFQELASDWEKKKVKARDGRLQI